MEQLLQLLKDLGIDYKRCDHPAVFTVEESRQHDINMEGSHCKNFFLKDKKGKYFLFSTLAEKKIDMNVLQKKIGCKRLSFASPQRLDEVLDLTPGSVSPFGIMNDRHALVTVVLDKEIIDQGIVNFHPLKNTATITVASDDLIKFIEHVGNYYMKVEI